MNLRVSFARRTDPLQFSPRLTSRRRGRTAKTRATQDEANVEKMKKTRSRFARFRFICTRSTIIHNNGCRLGTCFERFLSLDVLHTARQREPFPSRDYTLRASQFGLIRFRVFFIVIRCILKTCINNNSIGYSPMTAFGPASACDAINKCKNSVFFVRFALRQLIYSFGAHLRTGPVCE